ncbi:MAG: sensor histidine kinase [Chitinivibrionia bacterium]|nr:sensor histidine kinase [Chitinivibrionia bacterium]
MHYTLCDYLLDIVQNSVEANSSEVILNFEENEDFYAFCIVDNGKGMSEEIQKKAIDPFYTEAGKHSARKAGFGLPFLIMATQLCDGNFDLQSKVGVGTTIKYSFSKKSIDTPPLGNFSETILTIFNLNEKCNIIVNRKLNENDYSISFEELTEALGELQTVASLSLAKEYLAGLEEEITAKKI